MKKILIAIGLLLILQHSGFTQPAKPKGPTHLHLRVLAKAYEDSIVIRWAPENAAAWVLGKDSGYQIARVDYSDPQHPVTTMLSTAPFKPMSLEQMKKTLEPNDKYAAIAAQVLYGNDFRMTRNEAVGFAKKIKQSHDALNFRYSFALQAADFSAPAATALALRWVDKPVKAGGSYIYVVTLTQGNKNYVIDSAATFVVNKKEKSSPAPGGLLGFGFDRQIELHWNRRQSGNFSAYYIERSDDDGATFHVLNKLPYYVGPGPAGSGPSATGTGSTAPARQDSTRRKLASLLHDHQVYVDSIPQDYRHYHYRIRGINAFAELSPYSVVAIVQGRDLTPPAPPVIDSAKNRTGSNIDIAWTQRTPAPDLAGYYISRSTTVKGPFTPLTQTILPPGTRHFTDSAAFPQLPNYYVVVAVDTAKNVAASAAYPGYLTDTIPPAPPTRLAGTIDSNGIVHLHWAANREPDLKGYKVYYAYGKNDVFSQIGSAARIGPAARIVATASPATILTDTSFTDTISQKSLNRRIFYKVVAIDNTNNHSQYSAPAVLTKIVVVPPSAPVAGTIAVNGRSVTIEWLQSRSEGAAGYQILRKGARQGAAAGAGAGIAAAAGVDTSWHPIARLSQDWTARSLHFTDTTIAAGTDYYYAAQTIDSTGSRSALSFPVHVRSNATDPSSLANLQARLDSKQHHVSLSWQYKDTGDYFFVVYRSVNNGTLDAWQSFDKNTLTGEDDHVSSGTYHYAIKIIHRDKPAASAVSTPIQVLIQ